MMFRCRIADNNGKITRSLQYGDSIEEVAVRLKGKGSFLLSWEEKKREGPLKGDYRAAVLELTQSLSMMVQSGLTLKEAFHITNGLYAKGKTFQLARHIEHCLQRGDSFAQAVESQGDIFPPLYVGMIRVGQKLGKLDQILFSLGEWLRERKVLRSRIIGALIYPSMVLFLVFAGILALLVFFLPQMNNIVSMAGGETEANLEQAMHSAITLIAILGSVFVLLLFSGILWRWLSRHYPESGDVLDSFKLRIPILKRFILSREMLSLTFTLSILTQCGVVLEEALVQAAEVLENRYLRKRLLIIQEKLLKGEFLSVLVNADSAFPPEFSRWTALGERIGLIDRVFSQLKNYYQEEMNKILNSILTLAEPVVILILGVMLLVIILKIILPLLTLYGGMG